MRQEGSDLGKWENNNKEGGKQEVRMRSGQGKMSSQPGEKKRRGKEEKKRFLTLFSRPTMYIDCLCKCRVSEKPHFSSVSLTFNSTKEKTEQKRAHNA